MQRYLLFDAGCLTCHSMANAVETASSGWLVVRSLSNQDVQQQLAQAKPQWKWEPTLLEVEQDRISAYTGMQLRLKLLRGLGPQRTWQTIQLMRRAIEPQEILNPQRRRFFTRSSAVLGGLLLGIGGGTLTPSQNALAHTSSQAPQFHTSHLAVDIAQHQLAKSQTFHEATKYLGSPNWEQTYAYQSVDGHSKGLVLFFPSMHEAQSSTFLAIDDPLSSTTTIALIGQLTDKGNNHAELAWKTHKGIVIATQTFQDGKGTVITAPQMTHPDLQVHPDFNFECFTGCLGASVSTQCALYCLNCALGAGLLICGVCGVCAGPAGVICASNCNF